MFYHGIHARRRTGEFVILAAALTAAAGEPPQSIIDQWRTLSDDPRVGAEFSQLQQMLDSRIVQSYELGDPDIASRAHAEQVAAEEARASAARISEARQLISRLEQLEREGLKPEDIFAAKAEEEAAAEAARKAEEEAAAAAAARKAEEEAAANSSQGTAPGAGETHNLDEAGSTPVPATNPDGAEDTAPPVPAPSSPRGRLKPPSGN